MNRRRLLIALTCLAPLLLVAVWLLVPRSESTSNATALKVGALLPQTGPGAVFAEYIRKGLELAQEEINAERPGSVELIYGDSKNQPQEGLTVFRQLVLTHHPPVVITALSSVTRAVAPLAQENKTVVIGTAVAVPQVTAPNTFVFRVYPEAKGLAGVIAGYASKQCASAAVIYINDDFGTSGASVFRQVFEAGGGRLLTSEPYSPVETDFRNQWSKINSLRPSCVWITGYGPAYASIVKQMRESRVKAILLADMTMGLPITLKNVGSASEGVVYVDGPMSPDFIHRYEARFAEPPSSYAGYAYDTIMMLEKVHRENGNQATAIRDGLARIKDYPGAMGSITIQPDRDALLRFVLMQVKDGKVTRFAN